MALRVRLKGLPELQRKLARLKEIEPAVTPEVKAGAILLRREARRILRTRVRMRTGALYSAIRLGRLRKRGRKGPMIWHAVGIDKDVAVPYVDPRTGGQKVAIPFKYGRLVEFGFNHVLAGHIPAKPFMREAFYRNRDAIRKRIMNAIKRHLGL